jgi:hypothetical protein
MRSQSGDVVGLIEQKGGAARGLTCCEMGARVGRTKRPEKLRENTPSSAVPAVQRNGLS